MTMKESIRLGEALLKAGLLDNFQLQSALGRQRQWGGRLGTALIELGFIDEGTLIKFLSEQLQFPAVDLSRSHISPKVFEALPKRVAEKYMAVPILIKDTPGKRTLVLAMAEPTDLRAIDEIEFLTNLKIETVVALESAIKKVLANYGTEGVFEPKEKNVSIEIEAADNSKRVEFIQGDMNLMDEVRKAQSGAADAEQMWPAEKSPASPLVDFGPTPTSPLGDFNAPPLEEFEVAQRKVDDSPLEMVAEEAVAESAEVYEDADVVEEPAPVKAAVKAEVASNMKSKAQSEYFSEDPYEYNSGTAEDRAGLEHLQPSAQGHYLGEEESVSVVGSFEELEAKTASYGTAPAESASQEVSETEVMTSVEEEVEGEPAEESDNVAEAAEVAEDETTAEMEVEPVEDTQYVAESADVPAAEPVDEVEAVAAPAEEADFTAEAAEVAEAAMEEAADEPEAVAEAQPMAENAPETDAEIKALRAEIARLAEKMEGLVSLFILHAEGKLSAKEFVEELRNL